MNLHRLRYVTRHYGQLQGLRLVPLALVFAVSAVYRLHQWGTPAAPRPDWAGTWLLGGLTAAVVASWPIGSWYARRFGIARPFVMQGGMLPLVALTAGLLIAVALQDEFAWAWSAPAMFVAVATLGIGVGHRGVRRHYIAVALVFVGLAALKPLGASAGVRDAALDMALAVALLVGGVGDHVLLRRTLTVAAK